MSAAAEPAHPAAVPGLPPQSHQSLFLALDEVVHQRTRLAVICALDWEGEMNFNALRKLLDLSDGNLARHVTVLQAAGLVRTEKRPTGGRRRTYAELTDRGRAALDEHMNATVGIIHRHRSRCPRYTGLAGV